MKKILGILAILAALAVFATPAEAQFKIYGSYWNTSDVDDTFGGGLGFDIPFGQSGFALALDGTYYRELSDEPVGNLFDPNEGFFKKNSLEVLPVDVGIHYNFQPRGSFSPWIGGGATYFFIDTTRKGINVDDETGWHVSAGSFFGEPGGRTNFFAEALYRSTESTLTRTRNDNLRVNDNVKIDLDGFAVNAGLAWRFR
ncbi:MAG TPA: outer membrane beta-barrel protein [Thermoanaerobaculia bacterium]|nr:outer membrane beta-barrel protein [Thermoanaerobaculia bacterium]